jgi:hypothetical protein
MFYIKGRLLNSLNYNLAKNEREWRIKNVYRRELGYSFLQRLLISASVGPVIINSYIAILILGISFGLLLGSNDHQNIVRSDSDIANLVSYFSALWTVQAAISGLIYPIVISFVTFLLQRRHSAKASFDVYLNDTLAILSGVSGLSLILIMAIQHLLLSKVSNQIAMLWMAIDTLWFVVNLTGTIWFLTRTFEYLRPDTRAKIFTKYAINVVLPREVKEYLRTYLYSNASELGLLPGLNLNRLNMAREPSVVFGDFGIGTGVEEVIINIKGKRYFVDAHFRILKVVIKRWLERANSAYDNQEKPGSFLERFEIPLLIFPLHPGEEYRGHTPICRIEGNVHLSRWEKFLTKLSFSLHRAP